MEAEALQALSVLRTAHLAELGTRYQAVLGENGLDALVLHSGRPRQRRQFDDQFWPFLPVPPFAHFLPLAHPECLIILSPGNRPRLVRWIDDSFWEQPPAEEVPPDGFDVVEVRDPKKAADLLPKGRMALVGEEGAAVWDRFPAERRNPPALLAALDRTRVLKTPYEVACLAEANRRAATGHRRVAEGFQQGDLSELQLHLVYLATTDQDDPETPYKNIVAKGEHAATLHHVSYGRRGESAGSLLLDAGATVHGYASDITRTHVRGTGEGPDRFRALVAAMDAMQQRLCALVRVGLPYEQLHDRSHQEIAGVLKGAGLIKANVTEDEAVERGVTRAFFPHGLGHSLGLQTHDVGCAVIKPRQENAWLRNTAPIAAGQVFTIEPGLYFIRSLLAPLSQGPHAQAVDWSVVELLHGFGGIRVEDDLHVEANGVRNLTREVLG